ncbi:MAG: UDP-N-acetylmuramoyl-L-alanyl-D-glutamate--2,6-diaminopimelate ligase [Gemmatimonadetes bacterium]|nr:UDP-N-acetylmuramoyl-L-alanyl-D-glutamate--2,6-diaminopimelate ligase [Gemmatimonadota bacterium]
MFCAVPGTQVDGHAFIEDAVRAGATAALVEREAEASLPQIVVSDAHAGVAHLAPLFEGDPGAALRLVGITGTNGKSTTAWLTRWVLAAEAPTAALGTLGTVSIDGRIGKPSLTTPGPIELAETLAELRDTGARAVALEASSHALDQRRVDGLAFDAVAFTSFSREHLEYHPDLDAYRAAKLRLLDLLAPGGTCALDAGAAAWDGVEAPHGTTLRYGTGEGADVRAGDLELLADRSTFELRIEGAAAAVELPLPAEFNVRNALAAAAVAYGMGLSIDAIAERLSTAPPVPGRMEMLRRSPVLVIRDFAHSPDACERALSTLRGIVRGRLIALLGCGGDRDPGKRPVMGEILTRLSDVAVVTSDNPRSEDPAAICAEMVEGLDPASYTIVVDRRAAIDHALEVADPDDAVVLLGKGHETTQIIGGRKLPFDEAAIVDEILGAEGSDR